MEGPPKKSISLTTVSPLNLHLFLPYPDARRLIWRHLNALDREMIRCAHNSQRRMVVSGPFLTWAVERKDNALARWMIDVECGGDYLGYFKRKEEKTPDEEGDITWAIAKYGDIELMNWFNQDIRMYTDAELLWQAGCMHGQLDFLRHVENVLHIWPVHEHMYAYAAYAARNGHVHILEYIRDGEYTIETEAAEEAAGHGHLHVLEWLAKNDYPFSRTAYMRALHNGRIPVLDWLAGHLRYYPSHVDYMVTAVKAMQLPSIIWLHSHGCPVDSIIWDMVSADEAAYTANGIRPWLLAHYRNE